MSGRRGPCERSQPPLLLSPSGTTDAYTTDAGPSTARASWIDGFGAGGGGVNLAGMFEDDELDYAGVPSVYGEFVQTVRGGHRDDRSKHSQDKTRHRTDHGLVMSSARHSKAQSARNTRVAPLRTHRSSRSEYNPDDMFSDISSQHNGAWRLVEQTTKALIYQLFPFLSLNQQAELLEDFTKCYRHLVGPRMRRRMRAHLPAKDFASALHDLDSSSEGSSSPPNKSADKENCTPRQQFTRYACEILAFLVATLLAALTSIFPAARCIFRDATIATDAVLASTLPSGLLAKKLLTHWHRSRRKIPVGRGLEGVRAHREPRLVFDQVVVDALTRNRIIASNRCLSHSMKPSVLQAQEDLGNRATSISMRRSTQKARQGSIENRLGTGEVGVEALQARLNLLGALATAKPVPPTRISNEKESESYATTGLGRAVRPERDNVTHSGLRQCQERAALRPLKLLQRVELDDRGSRRVHGANEQEGLRRDLRPLLLARPSMGNTSHGAIGLGLNRALAQPLERQVSVASSAGHSALSSGRAGDETSRISPLFSEQTLATTERTQGGTEQDRQQKGTLGDITLDNTGRYTHLGCPSHTTAFEEQRIPKMILEALRIQAESFQAERQALVETLLHTTSMRRHQGERDDR